MSKRSGSPMVVPAKLIKVESSPAPQLSDGTTTFGSVSSVSKARLLQVHTLNYKPRVEVSINLKGQYLEVRFVSLDSTICITGDEFLDLVNRCDPLFLANTRLEPLPDGGVRIVRYEKNALDPPTDLPYFIPTELFTMSKYAVNRLRQKLDPLSWHVFRIVESEPMIHLMFNCIVSAYKTEYQRLVSFGRLPTTFKN